MRRAVPVAVVALVVAGLTRVLLLDWIGAVTIGLGVAVLGLVVQRLDPAGEPWRWLPERPPRAGERREALLLTWALAGRDGRVGPRALQRVQQVGAHRLARHGLDLASPADTAALRALIGPRALATLRCAREPWPRLGDIDRTVAALDRIGPGPPARTTISSRSNPR